MIPKIIHYIWFGRNSKSELANKCIQSWLKYCPEYEIIEWNEDNFDLDSAPLYVRQAYESKKWAFVSDYVRLWAMTEFGGIYMDTDVEVLKPLDEFLNHEAFSGFEDDINIPTGIMACEKGFPLFKELLHFYDDASFLNPDGTMNLTTNVRIITDICLKYGLQQNGKYQVVQGFALYPKDVFCPFSYVTGRMEKTRNTAAIHWFSGSWYSAEIQKRKKAERIKNRIVEDLYKMAVLLLGEQRYRKLRESIRRKK